MYQVQVRDNKTREVVENIGKPIANHRSAHRAARGVEINLDTTRYHAWVETIKDDSSTGD